MPILVLEHSDRCRCGRLAAILRDHGGHVLDVRRLHDGDSIPQDLDGIDGVISMGGPMSPQDDSQPWLESELRLLARAASMDLPVLGICLGCQLLARALGGEVEQRPEGPRLGWGEIDLTPDGQEDRLFAGLPWKWNTAHWNTWRSLDFRRTPPCSPRAAMEMSRHGEPESGSTDSSFIRRSMRTP